MDERILKWLYDIHDAIIEIERFFVDIPKDFTIISLILFLKEPLSVI